MDSGPGKKEKKLQCDGVLRANNKIDIPLWLGVALAQRDVCTVNVPLYLGEKYLNLIKSGSEVVNMRNQSHNIYENILKVCSYLSDEKVYSFIETYKKAFIDRFIKTVVEMADSSEVN